jgi:uncharacterized protein YecE (DUF72 family)
MTLYIGTSGWYYPQWAGTFYPPNLSSHKYLEFYAQHFNTVELNSPFYHVPTFKTAHGWYTKAPHGFRFTLKVNRQITHIQKMKNMKELLQRFYEFKDILQEKMGCFLFQFPKSYSYTEERLDDILNALDPAYENVIEFRHPSWWDTLIIQCLQDAHILFCSVSGLAVPETVHPSHQKAYIRLHGSPRYDRPYSLPELEEWKQQIGNANLETTWVYFNNTMYGDATQNAQQLMKMFTS